MNFHGSNFSSTELLIDPTVVPGLQAGDVLQLSQASDDGDADGTELCVSVSPESLTDKHKTDVSLHNSVADLFGLSRHRETLVRQVSPEEHALESITFNFVNQYLSRCDLWRFQVGLLSNGPASAYVGKVIEFAGMVLYVKALHRCAGDRTQAGQHPVAVRSGVVTPRTRFIFQSRSARVVWLVQLSREMWEFSNDGETALHMLATGAQQTQVHNFTVWSMGCGWL